MKTSPNFVIAGASLAGAKAAQALRKEGFDGRITLIGDELHRPYERPPLSKDYLQGRSERDKVFVHPDGWYAEHDVELRLGTEVTPPSTLPGAGSSWLVATASATTSCC